MLLAPVVYQSDEKFVQWGMSKLSLWSNFYLELAPLIPLERWTKHTPPETHPKIHI